MNKKLEKAEACKWLALFECMDQVQRFCKRKNIDFEYIINNRLKPNHIKSFIADRWPVIEENIDKGVIDPEDDFLYKFLYD